MPFNAQRGPGTVEAASMPRPPGLPPIRAKRDDAAHRSHQDCFSESAQYEQLRCAENLHLFYFLRHASQALTREPSGFRSP